jgi:hypothetical protein
VFPICSEHRHASPKSLQKDGKQNHFGLEWRETMSREKESEDRPRREKENMDEPQEEFIDISSVPSHTKEEEEEKAKKPPEQK